MKRLRPRSLQTRLTLWLLASVVLLFGLHWLVTSRAPVQLTEEYVATRLQHDAESLIVGLQVGGPALGIDENYVAPIYQRPYSGHYFVIRAGEERLRSRSLWDSDLDTGGDDSYPRLYHADGPMDQPLLVWTDRFEKAGRRVEISVAEDVGGLQSHIDKFRFRFALVSIALVVLLILAQRWIVRVSLRPLDRVREDCRRLERGEIASLGEDVPVELRPVVGEVNRLLGVMQNRLTRSRHALGNLAHALKTPLTLIDQVVQRARKDLAEGDEKELESAVGRMREIMDRELRRARLAGDGSPGQRFDLSTELPRLAEVIRRTHPGKDLDFDVSIPPGCAFRGDREDMYELFGNLLDNAAKWAEKRVRLRVDQGQGLVVEIEDDGPGVSDTDLDALARRGHRLDESRAGHGLGLSIVREIVELYDGRIRFATDGPLGGLLIRVDLGQ